MSFLLFNIWSSSGDRGLARQSKVSSEVIICPFFSGVMDQLLLFYMTIKQAPNSWLFAFCIPRFEHKQYIGKGTFAPENKYSILHPA